MNSDSEHSGGRVPLPGFGDAAPADPADRPAPARREGIRHVRRMSNWTAAALIVGTGAATVALAHHALPVAAPTAAAPSVATGTPAASAPTGTTGPQATHSVATTSGSGATVTTTTRTVSGKTVVSRVRHVPVYHDN